MRVDVGWLLRLALLSQPAKVWRQQGTVESLINDLHCCLPFTFCCIISSTHDIVVQLTADPTEYMKYLTRPKTGSASILSVDYEASKILIGLD